jgi:hypothetical protein
MTRKKCVYFDNDPDKKSFFVDAKRVIGSHKSKTGRQCNGQSKKEKMINSGLIKQTTMYTEN